MLLRTNWLVQVLSAPKYHRLSHNWISFAVNQMTRALIAISLLKKFKAFSNIYDAPTCIRVLSFLSMTSTPDFQASEFLDSAGGIALSIATGLRRNSLDRRRIRELLSQYSGRAFSDGRLIDAARCDSRSVDHAILLLDAHVELLSWLVSRNYTITSASIKWYSWRKLSPTNLFTFFQNSRHLRQLQTALDHITEKEALLSVDISRYQVCKLWFFV